MNTQHIEIYSYIIYIWFDSTLNSLTTKTAQTLASFNSKFNTNKSVKSEDKLFPYSNLFFYDLYKSTWRYSCSYSNFNIKRVHSIKKKGSLRGPNIISIAVRKVREECYIRICLYHNTKNVSFAFSVHFIVCVVTHKKFGQTKKQKKTLKINNCWNQCTY